MMGLDKTFLVRKVGPLPMWGWMGGVLGLALAYALYRNRKAAATASTATGVTQKYQLPDTIQPSYTFIDSDSQATVPTAPPGGGRDPVAPFQPSGVTAVPDPADPKTKLLIKWSPVPGSVGYIVSNDTLGKTYNVAGSQANMSWWGLKPGGAYDVRVASVDKAGKQSEWSQPGHGTLKK